VVDIFIGIGSNINPKENISQACNLLEKKFPSIKFSRVFESASIGFDGDNFLNLAGQFDFNEVESLDELITSLKKIENQLGRQRGEKKFSARTIDIDVLLFGDLITNSPIELPRGEILENAYVLWPLSELAPDLKHPVNGKSYRELWDGFDKSLQNLAPLEQRES